MNNKRRHNFLLTWRGYFQEERGDQPQREQSGSCGRLSCASATDHCTGSGGQSGFLKGLDDFFLLILSTYLRYQKSLLCCQQCSKKRCWLLCCPRKIPTFSSLWSMIVSDSIWLYLYKGAGVVRLCLDSLFLLSVPSFVLGCEYTKALSCSGTWRIYMEDLCELTQQSCCCLCGLYYTNNR